MTFEADHPMTDHEGLLLALVEGELDPAREAAVLAGLDAATLGRVQRMRRQRMVLRSVADVAPPAGMLDRVGAMLEREAVTGPAVVHSPFRIDEHRPAAWARRLAVAAGLALMAGGVGYWSVWLSGTPGPAGPAVVIKNGPAMGDRGPAVAITTVKPELAAESDGPDGSSLLASAMPDEPPPMSLVDFDDPLEEAIAASEGGTSWKSGVSATHIAYGQSAVVTSAPLGVFPELPTSLDLEDAVRLAEEGRLVIRVRADRPALAAARLLSQADSRADKGRLWRLMPCPPVDFSAAVELAMPPDRTDGNISGVTVPFRSAMRPTVETTLSVELDPSVAMLAIVQSELESISEGAVILDVLDRPVSMAPPCSDEGGLRRWTNAPSSAVHSVVVPVVVESGE